MRILFIVTLVNKDNNVLTGDYITNLNKRLKKVCSQNKEEKSKGRI